MSYIIIYYLEVGKIEALRIHAAVRVGKGRVRRPVVEWDEVAETRPPAGCSLIAATYLLVVLEL